MLVYFIDTSKKFNLINDIEVVNNRNNKTLYPDYDESFPEKIKNVSNSISEIEQLQSNVLNSLNYTSSQNVLPSTLPGQLSVKFLNTSMFDKLRDRITQSQIA